MANIPALRSGRQLHADDAPDGPYGPGGLRIVGSEGRTDLLNAENRVVVSYLLRKDAYQPMTGLIQPESIGYVNRFIADDGNVIVRNWRTKVYELKGATKVATPKPKRAAIAAHVPAPTPAPVVVPTPAPVVVAAPVQTVVASTHGQTVQSASAPVIGPVVKVKRHAIDKVRVVSIGDIVVPEAHYDTLLAAWKMRELGKLGSVSVTGPSGTAKTLLIESFANSLQVPFIKQDGGLVRTADDWFATPWQNPETGVWGYQLSPFGQALVDGTPCVVLLDEANRAETPQALNAALGLLDKTGKVYVSSIGRTLTLPKGVMVVVTANKGAEYVGTVPFDAAVTQRFGFGIRLDYPTPAVEVSILTNITGIDKATAQTLVNMAIQQRPLRNDLSQFPSGVGISPRMLVDISDRVVTCGTPVRDAILSNFAAQFDVEDETALAIIVDTHFPPAGESGATEVDTSAINEAPGV